MTPYIMKPLSSLATTLFLIGILVGCSTDPVSDDSSASIPAALQEMGTISYSTDADPDDLTAAEREALQETRKQALFASTRIVASVSEWQRAMDQLEALSHDPRFEDDYASQQIISTVALQGILLAAPHSEDVSREISNQVSTIVRHGGIAFDAMVQGIERASPDLDAPTTSALQSAVAERFAAHEARCTDCLTEDAGTADAASAPSVLDRLPPSLRDRAIEAAERNQATRARIRDWSS